MKILLAVIMSTVLTGTAFGACSKSSPQECTTSGACEALSSADGQKFAFDSTRAIKCQVLDTAVATNCLENNGSTLVPARDSSTGTDKPAATPTTAH